MASLTAFMQTAAQYWYIPAALVVLGALVFYYWAYFRAQRPRDGTLEWIALHDRPHLRLQTQGQMTWRDLVALCAVSLVTLAAWAFALLPLLREQTDGSSYAMATGMAYHCAAPVLNAALAYLLMKQLGGSTAAAILGGCLLGMNLLTDPTLSLFLTAASLFACRFGAAAETRSFGGNAANLLLCALSLVAGCYFRPALSLFAIAILVLLVLACVLRFINRGRPDGYLPKTLLVFVAGLAVSVVLVFLPAAALWGRSGTMLLLAPFTGNYYVMIAQRAAELFSGLLYWDSLSILSGLYYDWPLLVTGLLAVLTAVVSLLRRRDGLGLILTLLLLGAAAMWLLAGSYALPVVCALALSCLWASLLRRGRRGLVATGAAVLLTATAVFNTFFFWYPQLADLIYQFWRNLL